MKTPTMIAAACLAYLAGRAATRSEVRAARRHATTDSLTGLINRTGLEMRLNSMYGTCQPYGLLLMDLNGFKPVNDTHGHRAGDRLLREIGARLRAVPGLSLVARLGGDEFVGVAPLHAELVQIAHTLRDSVAAPIQLQQDLVVSVSGSVGIAGNPGGDPPGDVMHAADEAMYRAKKDPAGVAVAPIPWPVVNPSPQPRLRDTRNTISPSGVWLMSDKM